MVNERHRAWIPNGKSKDDPVAPRTFQEAKGIDVPYSQEAMRALYGKDSSADSQIQLRNQIRGGSRFAPTQTQSSLDDKSPEWQRTRAVLKGLKGRKFYIETKQERGDKRSSKKSGRAG